MIGIVKAQDYPKNIVGLRAGFNASWVTSEGVSSSVKPSYVVGVSDQVLLGKKLPFYFETGLNFISKGYEIKGYDNSVTTFNYLQLPVAINYHIYAGKKCTVAPSFGLYYALGVGGKRRIKDIESSVFTDGSTSRHDFGLSCGLSAAIDRFYLGISYEMGLINIDKADMVYGENSNMLGYKNIQNRNILVKAGINF